jgi:ABC transport system ATP-binding/permease protein
VRMERREKVGLANLQIQEATRSGDIVVQANGISHAFGELEILQDFSTTIMRGDKVGIVGRNGSGKTTLLRIMLGQLAPQAGKIRTGTNLQIAYFDQLRGQLDEQKTIEEEVGDGYKSVEIGGRSQHIIGYLQEFLFSPQRARTRIQFLSGGERNRVLLAKLFAKPANVIVLDEPTNDLDAETLEMLEERLVQYQGTLLVVSHDREFLNNVVTSCLVFEAEGVREYVGGYDDWVRQSQQRNLEKNEREKAVAAVKSIRSSEVTKERNKLSFHERKELDELPQNIEELETTIASMHEQMATPDYYKKPAAELNTNQSKLVELQSQLETLLHRWEQLESRA